MKKAEKAYAAAAVGFCQSYQQLPSESNWFQLANYGVLHIHPGLLIFMHESQLSDEPAFEQCTYFLKIDKPQRAKQVDPSGRRSQQIDILAHTAPKTYLC